MLNITEYCDYENDSGFVDVSFTRQMEPYICLVKGNYTTQHLLSDAKLSEPNAGNLYQLIRKNISQGNTKYFNIASIVVSNKSSIYFFGVRF